MTQDKFTLEEWNNLVEKVNKITQTNDIPENQMGLIWNAYQRIEGVNTRQPCKCLSHAKYWIEAINVINDFIRQQK
jgi:hypothetical protein